MTTKWPYSRFDTEESFACLLDESLTPLEREEKSQRLDQEMLEEAGWTEDEWFLELERRLEFEPEDRQDILYHELSDEAWAAMIEKDGRRIDEGRVR